MKNITEKAFAKINLFLDVLSVRADGFHEVKTVMHSVTLADELTFSLLEKVEGKHTLCVIGDDSIPTDKDNLVLRAVSAFESRHPLGGSLNVTLKKNIPSAAGLGGGSSDAAATLRALNRLVEQKLSDHELLEIAASLGSDVPFCLDGGAAICLGRGERLEKISPITNLHLVMVKTNESVSTPAAYRRLDEIYDLFRTYREDYGREEAFSSVIEGNPNRLYNVFEEAIFPLCPSAKAAKEKLISLGATSALMSGSGPSVFGVFPTRETALSAVEKIKEDFSFVCYAQGKY